MSEAVTKQQYICTSCGFIYDPDEGDPDGGIPPGTPFEDIPDDWFCPVCGARKKDFELHEGWGAGGGRARRCRARGRPGRRFSRTAIRTRLIKLGRRYKCNARFVIGPE